MTTGADLDQLPLRRAYRGHRDDIAPIACASATPARHSRNKSLLRKSRSKPKLPTSGMFPFFWNVPPILFHRVVVTTSRSIPLKLLSDEHEVCATWCLKIGRRAKSEGPEERPNLSSFESQIQPGGVKPRSPRQAVTSRDGRARLRLARRRRLRHFERGCQRQHTALTKHPWLYGASCANFIAVRLSS